MPTATQNLSRTGWHRIGTDETNHYVQNGRASCAKLTAEQLAAAVPVEVSDDDIRNCMVCYREAPEAVAEIPEPEPEETLDRDAPDLDAEHKRMEQIRAIRAEEKEALVELAEAEEAVEEARKVAKGKEANLEAVRRRLGAAIDGEPLQMELPLGKAAEKEPTPAADAVFEAAHKAWEERWEAFLGQSIDALGLPPGLNDKLRSHTPEPIETLKQLVAIKADPYNDGRGYTVIKGIGEGNADKIDNAYELLMGDFLKAHPEPRKGADEAPAEEEPAEEGPAAAWDFENTFPEPASIGPHDAPYDASYHRDVVDECLETASEIVRLERETGDEDLPARDRKAASRDLAKCREILSEEVSDYAGTFGESAGKALRAHVESLAKKQASLKGGLD